MTGYLFKRVLRHIDRIWCKISLKKTLKRHFVKCVEWSPSSPNVNPLDFFFWDLVKTKVYQGRAEQSFSSEEELKTNLKAVRKGLQQI